MKTVLTAALTSWVAHRGDSKGAALAFYALFSLTPILVLAIAFVGHFFGAAAAQAEVVAQVRALTGANGAQAIQTLLVAVRDPASGWLATLVASVLLLLGTTSVFVELKNSLDEMWGLSGPRPSIFRVLLRTRLLSFALVLVLVFLLLAALAASAVLAILVRFADANLGGAVVLFAAAASFVSYAVIACLFAVIYKTLPEAPLSWRDAWIGAAFTTGLFSLGKYAIGVYLGNSAVASNFGAAGSLIALLLWVYYSAQIFFLGAAFTHQFALNFSTSRRDGLPVAQPDSAALPPLTEAIPDASHLNPRT